MVAKIKKKDLDLWANYLLNYSLGGIQPDDVVMIKGEHVCWPLISVLQDQIFSAGGLADINIVAPDNDRGRVWGASIARHGTVEQIMKVPVWHEERYKAMTKYIEVLGAESPELFEGLPNDKLQALMKADEPFKSIRLLKPWVLTLYPTEGFADLEGMSLEDYSEVIVNASTTNPAYLEQVEEEIYQVMKKSKIIRISTQHPKTGKMLELKMNIKNQNIIKCTGKLNFPDGEVFTSPDANTVEGEIYVDLPVFQGGTTIEGIYLKFEKGIITHYDAQQGFEALKNVIETDQGSHRLGEVALGMNQGIQTVLKHPLFVEKVGGTLHIAIGASYPECFVDDPQSEKDKKQITSLTDQGILNKSAQHVDIVTDFRKGGVGRSVYLDNIPLVVKDNIWVVAK